MGINISKFQKCGLLLAVLMNFWSCSSFRKMALSTSSPILYEGMNEMETEGNIDSFDAAVTSNLKLVESLHFVHPTNERFLAALTKGYAAKGLAVYETKYLSDFFNDVENSHYKKQAILAYSKAIHYGDLYLKERGSSVEELQSKISNISDVEQLLDKKFCDSDEDLDAIFFLGQAMGSLIQLQLNDMTLAAQVPLAKALADWTCKQNPEFQFGTCKVFEAAYEAKRPKMLGGNPELGKKIFEEAIKKYPHNWFIRSAFLEFYAIPMLDEDVFVEQMTFLSSRLPLFEKSMTWHPVKKAKEDFEQEPRLKLYQALALERYKTFKKFKKLIFD